MKMERKSTIRLAVPASEVESANARETPAQAALAQAAEVLRSGGLVAFPTETVYGLGANALDAGAVQRIFAAKERPAWDPIIVHVSSFAMLDHVAASIPARAWRLMDAFWPGPLTLLLPKRSAIPDAVTADRPLVAVRMPAHPVARALIAAAGVPVAAPSANRFGRPSATTADHVLEDLDGRIDLILDGGDVSWDGGNTGWGVESTVVEAGERSLRLYRPGAVPIESLDAVAGPVQIYQAAANQKSPESLPSPGVGIRHYAPRARLVLVEVGAGPERDQQARWLEALGNRAANSAGIMLPAGWPLPEEFRGPRYEWGFWSDPAELARRLFAGLRALDAPRPEWIVCPVPPPAGLGAAIADRLRKAARDA